MRMRVDMSAACHHGVETATEIRGMINEAFLYLSLLAYSAVPSVSFGLAHETAGHLCAISTHGFERSSYVTPGAFLHPSLDLILNP